MEGLVISDAVRDLIINIINIIVLFVIVRTLIYKPVKKFLDTRTERVNALKADAEAKAAEAEKAEAEFKKQTEQSRADSAKIIQDAEHIARENAAYIIEDAKKRASDITEKAHRDAEKDRITALGSMKDDITGLALDISKQVLCREVTDSDNMKIADSFFKDFSKQ